MDAPQIRFDDGAAYEDFMGAWSRLAGEQFLQWLKPAAGGRWIDVGCGNGAFTELLQQRCAPASVQGVDPSNGQLAYARARIANADVQWQQGEATSLPFADGVFDAAVMALVIFFVPDPAKGVAEMVRVVAPGGSVSAYAWDILGGGFPYAAMQEEMDALGSPPVWPPSLEASRLEAMRALWSAAGLVEVGLHEIVVHRTYADFETFWRIAQTAPRAVERLAAMSSADVTRLQDRLRTRLPPDADGRIACTARANAVKGRVPAKAYGGQPERVDPLLAEPRWS